MSVKLYHRLKQLLDHIEASLESGITVGELADGLSVSPVHLQRLFKDAFGITLMSYIRSRRLAAGLETLANTDWSLLHIAQDYGFEHAHSYIRAFKTEFGLTPGQFRTSGKILPVKPPLQLFAAAPVGEGVLFGPEIVYVPAFYRPAALAKEFWAGDKNLITGIQNPHIYLGLTRFPPVPRGHTYYYPSVYTSKSEPLPPGFERIFFPASLSLKFHYIGEHHYLDLDASVAKGMYEAIRKFHTDTDSRYGLYLY